MKIEDVIPTEKKFLPVPVYKGTMQSYDNENMEFKFRESSRDTPYFIHELINSITKEKFGLPLRNLIFAASEYNHADSYGNAHIITPIGKWRAFVSPEVQDMTIECGFSIHFLGDKLQGMLREDNKRIDDSIMRYVFSVSLKKIRSFDDALDSISDRLKNMLKDQTEEFPIEYIDSLIEKFRLSVLEDVKSYTDSIIEVNSNTSKSVFDNNPEVMIYAPEGYNLRLARPADL